MKTPEQEYTAEYKKLAFKRVTKRITPGDAARGWGWQYKRCVTDCALQNRAGQKLATQFLRNVAQLGATRYSCGLII